MHNDIGLSVYVHQASLEKLDTVCICGVADSRWCSIVLLYCLCMQGQAKKLKVNPSRVERGTKDHMVIIRMPNTSKKEIQSMIKQEYSTLYDVDCTAIHVVSQG